MDNVPLFFISLNLTLPLAWITFTLRSPLLIRTSYHKDDNILLITNEGNYSINDIARVSDEIIRDYAHLKNLYNLDDFRDGEFKFQLNSVFMDLGEMRDVVAEMSKKFESIHTAVVFNKIANESLLNFFFNLRKPKNYHLKVFFNMDEAKEWLKQQQGKETPWIPTERVPIF